METVTIYYDLDDATTFVRDDEAREAAGKEESGAGTYLPTRTRDMTFRFETETEAEAAKKQLKEAGFRFIP